MKNTTYILYLCLLAVTKLAGQGTCLPTITCPDAPLFCGYELEHGLFNNNVQPGGGIEPNCGILPHNSVWFRILPCSPNLLLVVSALTSQTNDGLQLALFSACAQGMDIACNNGMLNGAGFPLSLNATVTPGQEYWLMVDGYEGDICDFQIDVISGLDINQPIPDPNAPFDGNIVGPSGFTCSGGEATYTVTWPGCDNWTGSGFSCAADTSCVCIHWELPVGAFIIGDTCAATVTINFAATPPGNYLLKATPECKCAENTCPDCGPVCCPVNPAILPIFITAPQVVMLPEIVLCNGEPFPDCVFEPGGGVNGVTAWCLVSVAPTGCSIVRQPYRQDVNCVFICNNLNDPAPPGDSCAVAPFFCGNFLEHYCGSNEGLSDDVVGGTVLQNAGFIHFQPCSDSIVLSIGVGTCNIAGTGLNFGIYEGECAAGSINLQTIHEQSLSDLTFTNLQAGADYTLVVSGVNNSECSFVLEVAEGIGTATPGEVTCSCTDGQIEGPDKLCPGDMATYTIQFPDCTLSIGPPTGGNGYTCMAPGLCPESGQDSFKLVWHIPQGTSFIGDSTGTTIDILVGDDLVSLDSVRNDSVWVSWELVMPPAPVDSLNYCTCSGIGCVGTIKPKYITVEHHLFFETCMLTCVQPVCQVEGVTFTQPGQFSIDIDNCTRFIVGIFADFTPPPPPFVPPVTICQGAQATLTISNTVPFATYNWSTGQPGSSITVSPAATTTYRVTATNQVNGCTVVGQVVVTVLPLVIIDLGVVGTITCQQPCVIFQGQPFCQPGTFEIPTGNCQRTRITVLFDPSIPTVNLPPQTICEGECVDFFGQQLCTSGEYTHEENCTQFVQQVTVLPVQDVQLGVVASVTCAQSCVDFQGITYCAPGTYTVQTGQCSFQTFEIIFEKDTLELGEVGVITCAQPCVDFEGQSYCNAGNYTTEDSCLVKHFSIGFDPFIPTVDLPTVTICEGQCFDFFGQSICTSSVVSQENNCILFVQEVIVLPLEDVQLGVVANVTCAQTCVDFQGITYCMPGIYTLQTGQCSSLTFEIIFEKDTLELGEVGVITCAQPCVDFEGQSYCAPGNYTAEDSCVVKHFSIGINTGQPVASAPTHNCLPSNAQYTVAFSITGLSPFKVNGVTLGGSNYLSAPVQNGASYAFVVEQNNGCQTVVSGNFNCASMCNTNAGLLSPETLHGCAGQSMLQVQTTTAATLALNDVVEYWLQKADGTLLVRNNTGAFVFDATLMTSEQTYFARRLVGVADQDGHPDLQNICTDSSSAQPLIFHALPDVAIAGETAVCRGNTLTLQASGAKTYQWQDGSNTTELVFNTTSAMQTQVFTVVGVDAVDCIDTATFALNILENPVLDEVAVTPPHCSNMNDGAIEIKQAHGTAEPLTYSLNGLPPANGSSFENLSPGAYTLSIEDAFGCEIDSVFNLPEPVLPSLNIGPDRQINIGTSVTLNADASTPPVNISWSADNSMSQSGGMEWTLMPLQHVLVHCEMVDANGCIATDEAQILVKTEDGIYRPNVLMIGANQGENQHFTIFSVEGWIQEIISLQLYDRWGEMVWEGRNFQANTPTLGWDGTNKGEMAMPGVYVYLAVVKLANGEQQTLKGDVSLVR